MAKRLALTGTPGTGKTSVAYHLVKGGWGYLDVADYAKTEGFVIEEDEARGSLVLDEEAIAAALAADAWPDTPCVIDSHIAHLLPAEVVVVLRCEPLVLAERLRARGWPEAKVRENVEAEAMSVIAEECDGVVVEVDTTKRTTEEIAADLKRCFLGPGFPPRTRIGWDVAALPWV